MARTIRVRVITNEGQALVDEAVSVVAPGEIGYVGFLYNHAPLVTTLMPGVLRWRTPEGHTRRIRVQEGLLEIVKNQLTVLTSAVAE